MHSVPRGGSLGPEVQPKHRWHTPAVARERTHEGRVNSPRNTVVLQGGIQKDVERMPIPPERTVALPGRHACAAGVLRVVWGKLSSRQTPPLQPRFLLLTIGHAQLISSQKPKPLHSRDHERCARATRAMLVRAMLVKGSLVEGFC